MGVHPELMSGARVAREMVLAAKRPDGNVARLLAAQARNAGLADEVAVLLDGYADTLEDVRELEDAMKEARREAIDQWRRVQEVARSGGQMDLVEEARRKDEGGRMKDEAAAGRLASVEEQAKQEAFGKDYQGGLGVHVIVEEMERLGLVGLAVDDLRMDALSLRRTIGAVIGAEIDKRPGQERVTARIDRESHGDGDFAEVQLDCRATCETPGSEWVTRVHFLGRDSSGGRWCLSGERMLIVSPEVAALLAVVWLETRDRERVRMLGMLADALGRMPGWKDDAETVAAVAAAVKEKLGKKLKGKKKAEG